MNDTMQDAGMGVQGHCNRDCNDNQGRDRCSECPGDGWVPLTGLESLAFWCKVAAVPVAVVLIALVAVFA